MFLLAFQAAHIEHGMKAFGKLNVRTVIRLKARQKGKNAWIELLKRHMINIKKNEKDPEINPKTSEY
jgi:hypothetical protein